MDDVTLIPKIDSRFPKLLLEIPNAPRVLYGKGNEKLLQNTCIAIVGTRKATGEGLRLAREFARDLAARGITIVSGLAIGIDAAAHEGALEAHGKTIAVLGNGLDEVYPKQNERLAQEILENDGLLISEYPSGTPSLPHQFLERNRIVSGVSVGVIVVEAPERSGALSTAAHALEQNREVFVLPGPVKHPNYKGSHGLIKAGACLVSSPEEVLEELRLDQKKSRSADRGSTIAPQSGQISTDGMTTEGTKIIEVIQNAGRPLAVDRICELTKIEPSSVLRILGKLTLEGIVKEESGTYHI